MKPEKPMSENQKENGNKLYKFLMKRDVVTKEEMLEFLGWDSKKERQLRDILSLIGQKVPLIATSDQKGYKIAKTKEDLREVEHSWSEIDSRIQVLEKRKEPLIKFYNKIKYSENNSNALRVHDRVIVTDLTGREYLGTITNINEIREPNQKYAVDIDGVEDVIFVSEKNIRKYNGELCN